MVTAVLSGSAGVQEQCWERIEVSSGNYHKDHLTDGNKLTYWESSGRSGSHWIRVHVKKDVTIRYAFLTTLPSLLLIALMFHGSEYGKKL